MPSGLGFAPLGGGGSVVGFGLNDAAPVQLKAILQNRGSQGDALFVDPTTGQYAIDTYGRKNGMTGVQQLVLMRIKTLLDSSAQKGLGLVAPSGSIGPNVLRRLEQEVRLALKDLLDANLIKFIKVTVQRLPSGVFLRHFVWQDLTLASPTSTEPIAF